METARSKSPAQAKAGLVALAFIAFISLGLPDGLLGVAWPSMRADFARPLDSLGLMLLASMLGYLASSFFSGKAMARLGVGGLLAVSCLATGAGLIGYTLVPSWWMIVALAVVAGLGAGAIDAGINTYIASEHGEELMQWLHASFGVGVTLGPVIMTAGLNLFDAWRPGYLLVGSAQIALAATFALTAGTWRRPARHSAAAPLAVNPDLSTQPVPQPSLDPALQADPQPHSPDPKHSPRLMDYRTPLLATLVRPDTWISLVMFFIYTGVEACLGFWAYTLLTESRGVAPAVAGLLTGSYWGMFTIGRILAGVYARRRPVDTLLRAALAFALLGAGLLWWSPAVWVGPLGVAVTGFSIAPIFPGLVSSTRARVGTRHAANTIGMQISAAGLGGAVISGLAGVLARRFSLEAIPAFLFALFALLLVLYTLSMLRAARAQ